MKTINFKRTLLPLAIFSIGCLSIFSCEKEELSVNTPVVETAPEVEFRYNEDAPLEGVEFDGEMLAFESWDHVEAVETYLANQVEAHNDAFHDQYPDLDDEAYNDLIEEMGFNEYLPLDNFEDQYSFNSKRKQMDALVEAWLAELGDELDLETFPDNFSLQGAAIRSLFNESGQMRVGDEVLEIEDLEGSPENAPCVTRSFNRTGFMYNHGFMAIIETGAVTPIFPFVQRATSNVISIQRRNFGTPWRLFRVNLRATVNGTFRDKHCHRYITGTGFSRTAHPRGRRSTLTARYYHISFSNRRFIPRSCDIEASGVVSNFINIGLCI